MWMEEMLNVIAESWTRKFDYTMNMKIETNECDMWKDSHNDQNGRQIRLKSNGYNI